MDEKTTNSFRFKLILWHLQSIHSQCDVMECVRNNNFQNVWNVINCILSNPNSHVRIHFSFFFIYRNKRTSFSSFKNFLSTFTTFLAYIKICHKISRVYLSAQIYFMRLIRSLWVSVCAECQWHVQIACLISFEIRRELFSC